MEDVQEDTNPTADTDHTDRESSSCFAAAAYVQRTNMTAGEFTQNKSPRLARTKPQSTGSKGRLAPDGEPKTYRHVTHIPVPIDIKHALSDNYIVAWQKAIGSELASLHKKGTLRVESLSLGHSAIGNKWVFKVMAKPDGQSTVSRHGWLPMDSVSGHDSTSRRCYP
jgi:hypothetical protein